MKLITILAFFMSFTAFASEDDTYSEDKFKALVYTKSCIYSTGSPTTNCYCDNQNWALGGGTSAPFNGFLKYSHPTGTNGWRVGCTDAAGSSIDCNTVYVKCMVRPE